MAMVIDAIDCGSGESDQRRDFLTRRYRVFLNLESQEKNFVAVTRFSL
jgi:hypothetical protein